MPKIVCMTYVYPYPYPYPYYVYPYTYFPGPNLPKMFSKTHFSGGQRGPFFRVLFFWRVSWETKGPGPQGGSGLGPGPGPGARGPRHGADIKLDGPVTTPSAGHPDPRLGGGSQNQESSKPPVRIVG